MTDDELVRELRLDSDALKAFGVPNMAEHVDDAADLIESLQARIADAWDEGHRAWQRRGPDECRCGAWSENECGCGLYGTGELLSLRDNPYRKEVERHGE